MQKPYWYRLLEFWVNDEERTGLSIPFLIGVDLEYTRHFKLNEDLVGTLLNEIINGEAFDYCVTIEYCGTIEAYRFGLIDRQYLNPPFFVNQDSLPTLAFKTSEFGGYSKEDMIRTLNDLYLLQIQQARFSRNQSPFGEWEGFSNTDRKLITTALADN